MMSPETRRRARRALMRKAAFLRIGRASILPLDGGRSEPDITPFQEIVNFSNWSLNSTPSAVQVAPFEEEVEFRQWLVQNGDEFFFLGPAAEEVEFHDWGIASQIVPQGEPWSDGTWWEEADNLSLVGWVPQPTPNQTVDVTEFVETVTFPDWAIPDPLIAVDDEFTVPANNTLTTGLDVLANDTNASGGVLSIAQQPNKGVLSVNGSTLSYLSSGKPKKWTGTTVGVYRVTKGNESSEAQIILQVT